MIDKPHPDESVVFHLSRSLRYRSPFGAVAISTGVDLCVDVHIENSEVVLCYSYGLYEFHYGELPMQPIPDEPGRYRVHVRMPSERGLFFYWFRLQPVKPFFLSRHLSESVHVHPEYETYEEEPLPVYYVLSRHKADGTGRVSDVPARVGAGEDRYPAAFQITVFDAEFRTPDHMKGAVIYQIFPDRFARDASFIPENMRNSRNAPERLYHDDWYEDVDIEGHPDTGYIACDFFGGNLNGIAERMDHLERMHVDCVYLNPIFEARSNHRYDTADYMQADPMLGGTEAFSRLVDTVKSKGMKLLLDGVFSHTGADSRYFNKLRRYKEPGAFQAAQSFKRNQYSSWYSFFRDATGELNYDSWWGFSDLPNVNENDLSYREFVFGENGVIRSWLRKGADGFRLDVSDELPDSFLRELRTVVKKETDGNGFVLGEVWEDASNKISYGSYRDFLFGKTHDAVMGYTFRDAVLGFFTWAFEAQTLNARLESYRENYPPEVYYCNMNLISSHDVPRALTVVGGDPDPGDRKLQREMRLNAHQLSTGIMRIRLALMIQMCYVGSPCIYYGDEVAIEGYRDPFNRRTYPWDRLADYQKEQLSFFYRISGLRVMYPVLKTGYYRTLHADGDVFIFERYLTSDRSDYFGRACKGPKSVILAINRNDKESYVFAISRKDQITDVAGIMSDENAPEMEAQDEIPLNEAEPYRFTLNELSYRLLLYS